jgi:hypothetical protein
LVGGLEHELTEEAHEIVSEDSEAEGGFCSPEVLQMEALNTEVIFEFLDAIFGITPVPIETPDGRGGKIQAGEVGTIAITRIHSLILPDLELSSGREGKSPDIFAHEDEASLLATGAVGMPGLADLHPVLEPDPSGGADTGLESRVEASGEDEGNFVLIKIAHHLLAAKAAVGPKETDTITAKDAEGLLQEVFRRTAGSGVTGTHPSISYHA